MLAVLWVALVARFVVLAVDDATTRDDGVLASAEVVWLVEPYRSSDEAVVRFTTVDGQVIEQRILVEVVDGDLELGGRVDVRYRPDDPAGTVVVADVDRVALWFQLLVGGPIVLVGTAAAVAWVAGVGVRRGPGPRTGLGQVS
ncbi:MAG TPA: DUF3592 domain-containing protein [Acidimicrobiales bacterium]|nr:DUF3592 domain-containing protein [Acidimicrobiales bacterium]